MSMKPLPYISISNPGHHVSGWAAVIPTDDHPDYYRSEFLEKFKKLRLDHTQISYKPITVRLSGLFTTPWKAVVIRKHLGGGFLRSVFAYVTDAAGESQQDEL